MWNAIVYRGLARMELCDTIAGVSIERNEIAASIVATSYYVQFFEQI